MGVTLPIVKHSYLVTDVNDIPRIVKEGFTSRNPDAGPVVIDVPKNIQQARTSRCGRRSNKSKRVCAATINRPARRRSRVERIMV